MSKTTIAITFNAPGADEKEVARCEIGETGITHRVTGDTVTFVIQHDQDTRKRAYRDLILGYAAAFMLLLPENSELSSVEPAHIDGQTLARDLKVTPAALMNAGIEIFRRSANEVSVVFAAIAKLRDSGHPAEVTRALQDRIALAADVSGINGQIGRGLSERLLAEGGADVGGIEIPGIGETKIIGEGNMAHVLAVIRDDEGEDAIIRSDGSSVQVITPGVSFSTSGLMTLSALMQASEEILREERDRFEKHLRGWADPVRRTTKAGDPEIVLGRWDGSEVSLIVTEQGEIFSENLPSCFPPDIISLPGIRSVFGQGRVTEAVSAVMGLKQAA